MAGRTSKLTPDVQKRICDAIAAGNYYEAACAYGGIGVSTYHAWMERGELGRSPYKEFREAVLTAEAAAEVSVVAQWKSQIPSDWRAARDFLARRFPARWSEKNRVEVSGTVGMQHSLDLKDLTDEELAQYERLVAATLARRDPGGAVQP